MRCHFSTSLLALSTLAFSSMIAPQTAHAQATTVYSTNFESPSFVVGTLEGQNGFAAYLGRNSSVTKVANSFASGGVQHLKLDSALLGQYGTNAARRAVYTYPTLNFNPITNNRPVVVARTDVALHKGNDTYLPIGYQIYSIAGDGLSGFQIDTDGDVVAFNFGSLPTDQIVVNNVAFDEYHTFTTRIDFPGEKMDYFLNGDHIGFLTIDPLAEFTLGDVDLFATTVIPAGGVQPNSVGYFDNYVIRAISADRTLVTGRITREGCETAAGSEANFEFRPTVGTAFTRTAELSAKGTYTLEDIPAGTYNIAIKTSNNLQKVLNAVVVGGSFVAGKHVTLPGGDANGDNSVDVLDLSELILAFDATPEAENWNEGKADFNCDNSVDVLDLDILIRNFDLTGDE